MNRNSHQLNGRLPPRDALLSVVVTVHPLGQRCLHRNPPRAGLEALVSNIGASRRPRASPGEPTVPLPLTDQDVNGRVRAWEDGTPSGSHFQFTDDRATWPQGWPAA